MSADDRLAEIGELLAANSDKLDALLVRSSEDRDNLALLDARLTALETKVGAMQARRSQPPPQGY